MEKKRSIGVTIIGILEIVIPILNIIGSYLLKRPITYQMIVPFCVSILCGVGILLLKEWARLLMITRSIYGIILSLIHI